jgi:hypothetical protein
VGLRLCVVSPHHTDRGGEAEGIPEGGGQRVSEKHTGAVVVLANQIGFTLSVAVPC